MYTPEEIAAVERRGSCHLDPFRYILPGGTEIYIPRVLVSTPKKSAIGKEK